MKKISIKDVGLVELTKTQLAERGITRGRRVVRIEDVNNPNSPTMPLSQAHKLAGSLAPSRLTKKEKEKVSPPVPLSTPSQKQTAQSTIHIPRAPSKKQPKLTISDQLPGFRRIDPKTAPGEHPFKSPYYVDSEGNFFSARQAKNIVDGKITIRQAIIISHKVKRIGDLGWRIPTEAFSFKLQDEREIYTKVRPFAQNDQINGGRQIAVACRGQVYVLYESEEDQDENTPKWRTPLPTANVEDYSDDRFWTNLIAALPETFEEGTVDACTITFFVRSTQKGEKDKRGRKPTRKGR